MKQFVCVFSLVSVLAFSQNQQLLYDFDEIPQTTFLNPAIKPNNDWFVGMPLASQIHGHVGSSGISAFDLFADDNRSFNTKLRAAIFSMQPSDFFVFNQRLDVFSGGFATGGFEKQDYISFGLYQETDGILYFPKDFAILAYEGNQSNINRPFDMSHLNVSAELISVLHLGYTKKINDKLYLGARGKIYSSIFNIKSTQNRGSFVTRQGENNFLVHRFNLDMRLQTAGLASFIDDENSDVSNDISALRKRFLFGGNLGLGVDIGFSYQITDQWKLDGSLLDIGFIGQTKDVRNYVLDGELTFEGVNPIFPEADEGQTAEEYWEAVSEDFEELFDIEETDSKYVTLRPIKLNASLSYSFGKQQIKECNCLADEGDFLNRVGVQLFAIKRPRSPQAAITLSYLRRFFNGWNVKATYTADSFSFTNVGLGTSINIAGLHVYALADNLLQYSNLAKAQNVSLQFGINYVFKSNEK